MSSILIVEDETDIRENIEDILITSDYSVLAAKNGREALNILDSVTPDLIISDIRMPEVTGLELLKQLSKSTLTNIPFLLLTALSSREDIRYGMDMGADDYITKPFTPDELLNSVSQRIRKAEKYNAHFERLKSNIMKYIPHELRTPLTPILGYSRMLLDDINSFSNDEILDMILTIKKSGLRLGSRVEKFILLSELLSEENFNNKQNDEDFRYSIGSNEIWKLLQDDEELNGRRKDLIVNFEPSILNIWENYIESIIKELIENASKFSDKGSKIKVQGCKDNRFYEITITDFGIGMTQDEIRSINIFEQFDREKMQQVGNGLGLVIIKLIVESIKGKFKIESNKGEFTKVSVSLPIVTN